MIPVRTFSRQTETDQCNDAGCRIGQVVKGVCSDGDGMGEESCGEFSYKQDEIEKNTDRPLEDAVEAPHFGQIGILVIRNQDS